MWHLHQQSKLLLKLFTYTNTCITVLSSLGHMQNEKQRLLLNYVFVIDKLSPEMINHHLQVL